MMNAATAHQRSRTYYELAGGLSEPQTGLESEFARLFVGPGRPVAHPFESVYREGRTMGECTVDVRRRLAAEGVAPGDNVLPDHVGIELAFMAHLASREASAWETGEPEEALEVLTRQDSFLQTHLLAWLPQFCHRVLVGRPHDFYAGLARQAETFVSEDAARVRSWLGQETETHREVSRQDKWAVTVGSGCTLCAICVQMCRQGALQLVHAKDAAVLSFEPGSCDGCGACRRWCPETIISEERVDTTLEIAHELARSELLPCPGCGRLQISAAMLERIQARMGAAGAAAKQRLALCPDCKARGPANR
ncbi:MAG TPA: molecular chaperone TorD family protein [Anaerolineae bacterium]|nr:molecular chaperone TorD family protein [Anaerolineae bacterium]